MADVVMPLISANGASDIDACDIVDAMGAVDLLARNQQNNKAEGDADFRAFKGSAETLEAETVADAQLAAAAVVAEGNTPAVDNPKAVVAAGVAAAAAKELPMEATPASDPRKRFVTPKDFELLKVIGMGAFGKVLQVKNRQSGQILAMKIISKRLLKRKAGYIENIQAERNILTRVNHPFVVTMHCSFQTREKLFIIMDFLAGGELFLRLGREGIFLEKDAAFYLAEIILGLDHLHGLGILHRDLKPENILLSHDGHICLTDFGLAKDFGPDWDAEDEEGARASTICGTQEYMSPEMLSRQRGYGKATDYWSLGCIAYEMLSGLPPFSSKQGSKELFKKIMSEKVKMPPGSTAPACKLLKGLLNRNPDARLGCARSTMFEVGGVAGLKQSAFFAKIDWVKLERRELKPPYDSSVDDFSDLRHFHNDFTSMPLPRSVREMTDLDSVPRRVESNFFRGFSFIQPDFSLPTRDESDVEKYWNAEAEGDGESDSEVASSKAEFAGNNEEAEMAEADKKKRPPRKRKKKGKHGNVDSSVATLSPVASEQGEASPEAKETTSSVADAPTTTQKPEPLAPAPAVIIKDEPATPLVGSQTTPHPSSKPLPTPSVPPKGTPDPKPKEWSSVSKSVGSSPAVQPPKQNWSTPGKGANSALVRPVVGHTSTPQRGWGPPSSVAATPQSATATSWAARAQQNQKTPGYATPASSTRAEPSRTPWSTPQGPPGPPSTDRPSFDTEDYADKEAPSPSSNWRQHSSPQVKRAINRSTIRTPQSNPTTPLSAKAPRWPSLNDFPSAPNIKAPNKPLGQQPTTAGGQQAPKLALKGAWANRAKP